MNIAVCEDNPLHLKEISLLLSEIMPEKTYRIDTYVSGKALLLRIDKIPEHYQIILMDIRLTGNENGILIAREINRRNAGIQIIFITGDIMWATKAGLADFVYFITKPIKKEALTFAIQKAKNKINKSRVTFQSKACSRTVFYRDILYIERICRTSHIHLYNGEIISASESLDQILKQLDQRIFGQCHKSFLVNLEYVTSFTSTEFMLLDKYVVPISRRMLKKIKNLYMDFECTLI